MGATPTRKVHVLDVGCLRVDRFHASFAMMPGVICFAYILQVNFCVWLRVVLGSLLAAVAEHNLCYFRSCLAGLECMTFQN